MKNGFKIRKLINEFEFHYDQADYAEHQMMRCEEEEKYDWEEEYDHHEYILFDIARQIKILEPSKYMMDRYPHLQDILEYA